MIDMPSPPSIFVSGVEPGHFFKIRLSINNKTIIGQWETAPQINRNILFVCRAFLRHTQWGVDTESSEEYAKICMRGMSQLVDAEY